MRKKIRYQLLLPIVAATLLLGGCGKKEGTVGVETTPKAAEVLGGDIGILFPSKDNKTQNLEARELESRLKEKGYRVEIAYAGENGETQAEQANQMINDKKNCLVVLPIDSEILQKPLEKAKKQGISVISYDRLVADTENISYYVGFDYEAMGESIGSYFSETKKLGTAKSEGKHYTMEFFMGDVDDLNCKQQMKGILKVLKPYMDENVLQVKSLRTAYEDVSIVKESKDIARETCVGIMQANYMDEPVDLVCVGADSMTDVIVDVLKQQSGFEENWPMVASCGISEEAFRRLQNGTQSMLICSYREDLPRLCADLIHQEIQGEEIRNLQTYDLDGNEVSAVFGKTELAYSDNYQQIMRDVGITLDQE